MVVVKCDEVLELGRGKGVRKLQEIARIGGTGRSSPGNGGWWQRSAGIRVREGLPGAGGGGPGAGGVGKGVALERGGGSGEEWVTEERTAFGRVLNILGRRRGREGKRRGEGGVRQWGGATRRVARGA
jgi:hypothetical protein